jgi:acetylornithine/succinyldiaminopimelate/putrescine aminotransferase
VSFDLQTLLNRGQADKSTCSSAISTRRRSGSCAPWGSTSTTCAAEGPYLFDTDGQRYLDLLSGFGMFTLGRTLAGHLVRERAQSA